MTIYDEMVAEFHPQNQTEKNNAQHEVMQRIALTGLYRGGFFEHAAFYGGTCLRIFHNLRRFSEDMDFTLTEKNPHIHLEDYFPQIIESFKLTGREVTIKKKDKKTFGKVESAFLKDNTDVFDIAFQTEKTIKVKIELDTNPPLGFDTEQKIPMGLPFLYCSFSWYQFFPLGDVQLALLPVPSCIPLLCQKRRLKEYHPWKTVSCDLQEASDSLLPSPTC